MVARIKPGNLFACDTSNYLYGSQDIRLPLILHINRQGITYIQSMDDGTLMPTADWYISVTGRKSGVCIGKYTQGYRILSAVKEVRNYR